MIDGGRNMKLRNFLYLNTKLLDDYLSSIEGSLSDTEEHTNSSVNIKLGQLEGGIPVIKGSGKAENTISEEVHKEVKITEAAKFDRLYNYLEKNGLQYYESIINDNFNQLFRDDFLEVLVTPRFSKLKEITGVANKMVKLADVMKQLPKACIRIA